MDFSLEARKGIKFVMKPQIIEEVPWSKSLTAYDKEHFTT